MANHLLDRDCENFRMCVSIQQRGFPLCCDNCSKKKLKSKPAEEITEEVEEVEQEETPKRGKRRGKQT